MENIDNSKLMTEKWAPTRDTVILEWEVEVSARKCEWDYTSFDAVLAKRLDPEKYAENFKRDHLDAVDFKNWGKNAWHNPKDEVDAYNAARDSVTNDDIMLKKAEFTEEETFKNLQPYHERKAKLTFALNVSKVLERERDEEAER